jgi:hypothetical protein
MESHPTLVTSPKWVILRLLPLHIQQVSNSVSRVFHLTDVLCLQSVKTRSKSMFIFMKYGQNTCNHWSQCMGGQILTLIFHGLEVFVQRSEHLCLIIQHGFESITVIKHKCITQESNYRHKS